MNNQVCGCGNRQKYSECCEPLHQGLQTAASAEQLMRSRYCAFVMQRADYLTRTHHPETRPADLFESLQSSFHETSWLGLTVLSVQETDNLATVDFVAFYEQQPIGQLHEHSLFRREQNQWFYLNGNFLPPLRLGRNQPCPCGSRRKLKHCHG